MTKRYDEPIEVEDAIRSGSDGGEAPIRFSWRGRRYAVEQPLSSWLEAGEWWRAADRRDREYHRVLARPMGTIIGEVDPDGSLIPPPGAVYDVYHDRVRNEWRIARVWD